MDEKLIAPCGTSSKLVELSNFGKEFMDNLQKLDKLEEVKQVFQDNYQNIEQVQMTIDTIKTEAEEIKSEVVETAKDAGVSQEEINSIGNEAIGIQATPDTAPAPEPTPAPDSGSSGGGYNGSSSNILPLGTAVPIAQGTPINFTGGIKLDFGDLSIPSGATVKVDEVPATGLPTDATVADGAWLIWA
ncbi:MAG: hypothetical protein ACOYIB_06405 [Desulfosporosinus sp.]|jgi:hypothetical protein